MRWNIFGLSLTVLIAGLAGSSLLVDWLNEVVYSLLKKNYTAMCKKWPSMCGDEVDDNDLSLASDENTFSLIPKQYGPEVFTNEQIASYRGKEKIYLAFLGQVYDVSEGKDFYGPTGGYKHFAGRDATRAFLSGDFTEEGLHDDLTDLPDKELVELQGWLELYRDKYKFIGVLEGKYFNADGTPTQLLKQLDAVSRKELSLQKKEKNKFPSCDMQWTAEKGTTWWCSTNSGGVQRDWVGLPRMYHAPGAAQARCVCVQPELLGDPHLRLVQGCGESQVSCYLGKQ